MITNLTSPSGVLTRNSSIRTAHAVKILTVLSFPLWCVSPALAESPQFISIGEPTVVAHGPHHDLVERITEFVTAYGKPIYRTNSYTTLATGLNYFKNGVWTPSQEEIELLPQGGAIARQGQHTIEFSANINTVGAIRITMPDAKILATHVVGLTYLDSANGEMVVLGEIKDSIGLLVAPNRVVYPDAFTGVKADIRITYKISGVEQEIVFTEAPISPALLGANGLNPATTKIEIYTELLNPPAPLITDRLLSAETDPETRKVMAEPDFIDHAIDFGSMQMLQGTAFSVPQNEDEPEAPVAKLWEKRQERFLG